jgi:small-conductance mechanosensitive channel
VKGTIRRIGIRSSIIQHGDGIETLIPNSTLLENQVTNWTLSNSHIQSTVQIDVEYGASTREVENLLLATADEHGLVLKSPAPEVRLTDLGKQSIEFSLLYWFDLKTSPVERLKSDLRFMIEKSLTDAGIHLLGMSKSYRIETGEPLRVEITKTARSVSHEPDGTVENQDSNLSRRQSSENQQTET